jgi:hypothetical protein
MVVLEVIRFSPFFTENRSQLQVKLQVLTTGIYIGGTGGRHRFTHLSATVSPI